MTRMITNRRSIIAVLSITIAIGLLAALMLSVASAAPSAPEQRFTFTKEASNKTPYVGDILTFTLDISPTAQLTQLTWIRVTDPNPAPAYLKILTDTIIGGAAVYSPAFNGVIREFTLTVGTVRQQLSFQVEITGMPATALTSGHPVTNTARIVDASGAGSLRVPITAEAGIRIMPRRIMLPLVLRNYAPFANGSFESGWTPWEHAGELAQNRTQSQAHEGQWSALLGDSGYTNRGGVPVGSGRIWQTFTVPNDGTPEMTIWYHIYTHDIVWGVATPKYYDSFEIYINTVNWSEANAPDPDDAWRQTRCRDQLGIPDTGNPGLVFCDGNSSDATNADPPKNLEWHSVTLDLSQFKGQNITLYLATFNRVDGWYNTWTYVDDMSLQK